MRLLKMKIESISITNFRSFLNTVDIEMSTDEEKNITVIHGDNGSGKTSLLNAFKWCFYGETDIHQNDHKQAKNDDLLNHAAIKQGKVGTPIQLMVLVKFEHEGLRYGATRLQRFRKIDESSAEKIEDHVFTLDKTENDGQTKRVEKPNEELVLILPRDLHPYFFFNGEYLNALAGVGHALQIQEAIKKLMGIVEAEKAIDILGKVKRQFLAYMKEDNKLPESQRQLAADISDAEETKKELEQAIEASKFKISKNEKEILGLQYDLKSHEKSKDLQLRREECEQRTKEKQKKESDIKQEQKKLIDESGYIAMSSDMLKRCHKLVDTERGKGILPFRYNKQFIEERIELGFCICGTEIIENSKEYEELLKVKETAGTSNQDQMYTSVSNLLKNSDRTKSNYESDYRKKAEELTKTLDEIEEQENTYRELSAQISKFDDSEISGLENKLTEAQQSKDKANRDRGVADLQLTDIKSKLEFFEQQLSELQDSESLLQKSKGRLDLTNRMIDVFEEVYESISIITKNQLSNRMKETFGSIIRKQRTAIINDDYGVEIIKIDENGKESLAPIGSTGERQVASLCFIASIISLAKEKYTKNKGKQSKGEFYQGGIYPLVMDSPFGALGDIYREKVGKVIPELADQVILFVTDSQWEGIVKQTCEERVGLEYQLISNSSKANDGAEYSFISKVEI